MILEALSLGPMGVNCYILAAEKSSAAVIIDPGAEEAKIRRVLERHALSPACVINTHGHYDHIGCDDIFGAPVYIHHKDLPLLRDGRLNLSALFALPCEVKSKIITLQDRQVFAVQGLEFEVLHIPGHTPGGAAFLLRKSVNKIVFTGDTLFCQGIGRSDLAGGSEEELIRAIKEKLLVLPDDTVIYPGHGPSSTIAEERKNNPFLQ